MEWGYARRTTATDAGVRVAKLGVGGVARALRERAALAVRGTADGRATYGVELEFLASRAPGLVMAYRPDEMGADAWEALAPRDRVARVMDWRDEVIRARRGREAKLLRTLPPGFGSHLPAEMTIEPNGVFEMRRHPFASCGEVASFLADVLDAVGVPQAQAHMVFPVAGLSAFAAVSLAQSDRAQFAKLALEAMTATPPAASFASGFLPPVDSASYARLARQTRWLGAGEELGDTLKYLCAPVLRPGALYDLPGHVGIEVRQWDVPTGPEAAQPELLLGLFTDLMELRDWMASGRIPGSLSTWAATPPVSEAAAWERARAYGVFPSLGAWTRVVDAMEFTLARKNAHTQKVNARCPFLFPLRTFDTAFPALAAGIRAAQETYLRRLAEWGETQDRLGASAYEVRSGVEAALAPLRAAVADFGRESGLARKAFAEVFGPWE